MTALTVHFAISCAPANQPNHQSKASTSNSCNITFTFRFNQPPENTALLQLGLATPLRITGPGFLHAGYPSLHQINRVNTFNKGYLATLISIDVFQLQLHRYAIQLANHF